MAVARAEASEREGVCARMEAEAERSGQEGTKGIRERSHLGFDGVVSCCLLALQ